MRKKMVFIPIKISHSQIIHLQQAALHVNVQYMKKTAN